VAFFEQNSEENGRWWWWRCAGCWGAVVVVMVEFGVVRVRIMQPFHRLLANRQTASNSCTTGALPSDSNRV
jgi:hypothetical protein